LKKLAISVGQEAKNDFKMTFDNLDLRFFVFIQIALWAISEAQNKLTWSTSLCLNTHTTPLESSPSKGPIDAVPQPLNGRTQTHAT